MVHNGYNIARKNCAPARPKTASTQDSEDSRGSPMISLMECGAPLAALHSMTEMKPQSASNPHGIDHILARPSSVQSPRALPPAISAAAAAASYYKHHTHPLADLTSRSPLYWPGLQGLVGNPMAWRDRLANSEYILFF